VTARGIKVDMCYYIFLFLALSSQLCSQEVLDRYILVTGCARSGTRYTAYILRDCGLDVGHEWMFPDGLTSWLMATDCSECPWGAAPSSNTKFQHIFHQVRDPLKVIASVYINEPPESWEFICLHLPQIKETDTLLVKCAKYWYYWNLMAEKKAEYTFRVEDIEKALRVMSFKMKRELTPKDLSAFAKNINTRETPPDLTWGTLAESLPYSLFYDVQMMALRYGYSID